jgi:hypothetical protein
MLLELLRLHTSPEARVCGVSIDILENEQALPGMRTGSLNVSLSVATLF